MNKICFLIGLVAVCCLVSSQLVHANVTYTLSPSPDYQDSSGNELTDGALEDGTLYPSVGWHISSSGNPTVIINLGEPKLVAGVRGNFSGGWSGIYYPVDITVSTSLDGSGWSAVSHPDSIPATPDGFANAWITTTVEPVMAQFVKMEIVRGGEWTFLSEVYVIEKIGEGYVVTPAPSEGYPDTSGKELTDGNIGYLPHDLDYPWAPYVGLVNSPTIILNLGEPKIVTGVSGNFGGKFTDGIYYPSDIAVYTSLDMGKWSNASHPVSIPATPGVFTPVWISTAVEPDVVQYIMIDITGRSGILTFLSEIEVETEEDYALSPSPGYPDNNDGNKLTNGALENGLWPNGDPNLEPFVGWGGNVNPTVIINLGEPKLVAGVRGYFSGKIDDAIFYPADIAVSALGENGWSAVSHPDSIPVTQANFTNAWITTPVKPVTAQYVKMEIVRGGEWTFLSEVYVMEKIGEGYVVAPAPSESYPDTGNAELTDGVAGGGLTWPYAPYVGWINRNPTIILNLGEPKLVTAVDCNFGGYDGDGIYYPSDIAVYTSLDMSEWSDASYPDSIPATPGVFTPVWISTAVEPDFAQYIMIDITGLRGYWAFLSEITVETNRPPVAIAVALNDDGEETKSVKAGASGYAEVALDGSGSYDPDGDPLTYDWHCITHDYEMGSGEALLVEQIGINFNPLGNGFHEIELTVSDGQASDTAVVELTVLRHRDMGQHNSEGKEGTIGPVGHH